MCFKRLSEVLKPFTHLPELELTSPYLSSNHDTTRVPSKKSEHATELTNIVDPSDLDLATEDRVD